ncbi:adenosine deaminase [Neorhizobium galegae]|uniref:adenosine deaminase n=1 Tax=Neorhizobium galegae TaxID=399 RepID=UPI0027861457|nr:adenosine deaminase [Neorhizobium galegae]MDQ0133823.1 adenosine deaminase [Neorhizobium galegae]
MSDLLNTQAIPKVELHLHLDCSLSFRSVSALISDMTFERYRAEYLAPPKCRDLVDYLGFLAAPQALLQNVHALKIATLDLFRQLEEDGVVYAEIRFAPHLHLAAGLKPQDVVEAVLEGRSEAQRQYSVESRIILCTLRHFDTAMGLEVVKLAKMYQAQGVGGIDLAGDEANYSLDAHIPVFRKARELGIHATAHAGEALGAESVREVVEKLGVRRIGHGVRSIESRAVIDILNERDVHLEVCPSCNIQIDVFDRYEDHPIDRLARQGLSVGVNTDARGPTDLTLSNEYERLREKFGWTPAAFQKANTNALAAAFIDATDRDRIMLRLV